MLCIMTSIFVFAQADESRKSAFQLSFFPPVSTNGLHASQYTNGASFNILVGISRNEKAFTFGTVSNIILNDASGFQFAGLNNYVANKGRGFQFAGLTNMNGGGFKGMQFAGLFNTAGETKGMQFAGLANIAEGTDGVQFAGLVNVAENIEGAQFAGLVNISRDIEGAQFAGLVNVAKEVDGAQFAILVNIAESSDWPFALVNIIKEGEKGLGVTYDMLGNVMLSFRSGGKYSYGILGVGYNHRTGGGGLVTEAGFGIHIPCVSWFRIKNEFKASSIGADTSNPAFNGGYYLLPAFKIGNHCEIFGGANISYMTSLTSTNEGLFPSGSLWKRNNGSRLHQVYIGYQVGVQYLF